MARLDAPEASVLKALSHPLRMRLVTFITERGEASPVEMSRALEQTLATVSHHTRVLRDSGCTELARPEPRRGEMEHYYVARMVPDLDEPGWDELSRAVLTLLRRAEVIQEHSDGRREGDARASHDARPSELAVLHFAFGQPQSPAGASRDRRRRVRPPRLPR